MIKKATFITTLAIFNLAAVQAELVLQPADLRKGDTYRLVFVTSGFRDASSPLIADYNSFVQEAATSSPLNVLGLNWSAIASTLEVSARDNTTTNPIEDGQGVPIYLVDGSLVATGNNDLWDGSILHQIDITETGERVDFFSIKTVWTGSNSDGTIAQMDWLGNNFPNPFAQRGRVDRTDSEWIRYFADTVVGAGRIYGISAVMTAVPEPTGLFLICSGWACLLWRKLEFRCQFAS